MLYISRRVIQDAEMDDSLSFGVVDTDDGVETIVSEDQLEYIVNELHISVKGVADERRFGLIVHPYQVPSTASRLQVKFKTLEKISLLTYNNAVTDVYWKSDELRHDVQLRLSDFGDQLDDVFLYSKMEDKGPLVTFVLDDKLMVIRAYAFHSGVMSPSFVREAPGWVSFGMKFDLREMTRESMVENVYRQLTTFSKESRRAIIDDKFRKARMLKKFKPIEER